MPNGLFNHLCKNNFYFAKSTIFEQKKNSYEVQSFFLSYS